MQAYRVATRKNPHPYVLARAREGTLVPHTELWQLSELLCRLYATATVAACHGPHYEATRYRAGQCFYSVRVACCVFCGHSSDSLTSRAWCVSNAAWVVPGSTLWN